MYPLEALTASCLRRISQWCLPPNYSRLEWIEEMRALGNAAAWQAANDYDPARGVPLSAFVRQRVMSDALTRYRQEWRYAFHCAAPRAAGASETAGSTISDEIRCALADLPENDLWLIEQLFFEQRTEADMARSLGISQQAVSKRKHSTIAFLRRLLTSPD